MPGHPESAPSHAAPRAARDPAHLLDVAALRQFAGAPAAIAVLEDAADRAVGDGRVLEDTLILGPEDCGKQVVAQALARDAHQRAVEVDAAWIRSPRHLSRVLRSIEDRDALLLRRVDELRPGALRMLASLLGMRTLPREADRGHAVADCTVIATAVALPRRMQVLRRMFPLRVELPSPCTGARTAAAYRAVQALGVAGSAEVRASIAARIEMAQLGCAATARAREAEPSAVDPAMVARTFVCRGSG